MLEALVTLGGVPTLEALLLSDHTSVRAVAPLLRDAAAAAPPSPADALFIEPVVRLAAEALKGELAAVRTLAARQHVRTTRRRRAQRAFYKRMSRAEIELRARAILLRALGSASSPLGAVLPAGILLRRCPHRAARPRTGAVAQVSAALTLKEAACQAAQLPPRTLLCAESAAHAGKIAQGDGESAVALVVAWQTFVQARSGMA
jgi:hypothetical protein